MKSLLTLCLVGVSTMLAITPSFIGAQDDYYLDVRFVNESNKPVQIKFWNPRDSRAPDNWTVEAGKSFDFVDEKGENLRVGITSSRIVVNDGEAEAISNVSARSDDGSLVVITWTNDGFKNKQE